MRSRIPVLQNYFFKYCPCFLNHSSNFAKEEMRSRIPPPNALGLHLHPSTPLTLRGLARRLYVFYQNCSLEDLPLRFTMNLTLIQLRLRRYQPTMAHECGRSRLHSPTINLLHLYQLRSVNCFVVHPITVMVWMSLYTNILC
jgi:hypothetical protein